MSFKTLAAALIAVTGLTQAAEVTSGSSESVYSVPVLEMKSDTSTTLAKYKGDVLLLLNVASKCGHTPQYEGLEKLNDKYQDKGLRVLGFPSNDFGGQEPGTEEEIVAFCKAKYDVSFPLYAKVHAKGAGQAPLYTFLTSNAPETGEVKWNFEKFLVGRDGKVVARFRSKVKPDDPALIAAVEKALESK